MSKVVVERIVCDEHEEDHEAPFMALVKLVDRKTGKIAGTYVIDVCEEVVDWYSSNGLKIIRRSRQTSKKQGPRKSVPRKNPSSAMIREWATSKGLSVSQKGRISKEVRQAYDKAHPIKR